MKRAAFLLATALLPWGVYAQAEESAQGRELCKQNYDSYKGHLSKNPDDPKSWSEFRACTDLLKRWPEAGQVAEEALQVNPNIPEAHLILGMTHYHTKAYAQSVDEYKESIRLKDTQAVAYFQLGMSYLYLNQPEEAVKAGVRATELAPTNVAYHRQLAYAYFLTNADEACEASAKKTLELDPNDTASYKILGNLYTRQGRKPEAEKMFEESIHAHGRTAAANPFVADKNIAAAPPPKPFTSAIPPDDTETFLKVQWNRMKETAQAGDIEKTLTYYSDYAETRETYRKSFERMGPERMREVYARLGELNDCEFVLSTANCKCPVSGASGTLLETKVRFEKNSDHIWRIKSF